MMQLSKKIAVNGWQNLNTLLKTNGWNGAGICRFLTMSNASASVTLYVHRGSATSAGLTAADGLPILEDAYTWENVDLNNTMINTASSIDIIFDLND